MINQKQQSRMQEQAHLWTALSAHRADLLAAAKRYLVNTSLAEDVVHDVLIKYLEGNPQQVEKPAGYLKQMVRNRAIDYARRSRFELADDTDCLERTPAASSDPEILFAQHETLRRIDAVLDSLPTRKKAAFERHRLAGESQKQIAQDLGVSPTLINFIIKEVHQLCQEVVNEPKPLF